MFIPPAVLEHIVASNSKILGHFTAQHLHPTTMQFPAHSTAPRTALYRETRPQVAISNDRTAFVPISDMFYDTYHAWEACKRMLCK